MNTAEILRGKCEATLEAMNNMLDMQHEVFNEYLNNRTDILLDRYITLGEVWKKLKEQYNKYSDELVGLFKGTK